ncbi:MAG: VirB4 family type IV secretion system protein [Acidimicrobiales bacterium]
MSYRVAADLRARLTGALRRAPSPGPGGLLGPDSVDVHPHALRLGAGWCRTFAVVGYPREVGPGWLAPLLCHPARLEVSVHIEPVPSTLAAERLRRQLARLESGRRIEAAKGRLADPEVEVAAADARDLADRVARGEGKLFRVGLYLSVHAPTRDELDDACAAVRGICAALLLDAVPASYRSLQGWITTLPFGVDLLRLRRTMDTAALAAAFPFASPDLPASGGGAVLYGLNASSAGLVVWDRFAADNHNAVILARSGSGKSYLAKLEALRSLVAGIEVAVVDPEDEYGRLAAGVGGTVVRLGAPGVRLNPFDLPPDGAGGADALVRRALFVHTLVAGLLGGPPDPASRAALDRGILAAYAAVGITTDPRTHGRPAPLLADLARSLDADGDPAAATLAARLAPFISGSYAGLFAGPTTTRPDGHLVVFSLRELPDELKATGTLLTLDAIWRRVTNLADRRRRLVLVDEAWLLMRDPEGARFLFRLAKAARKHWCGLTVVTQDAADLLGTDLGLAVVANAATQILLRQAPQAIDALGVAFRLSDGERTFLLGARRGEGILAAGPHRASFRVVASPAEHAWVTGLEPEPDERVQS